jgi:hypothetical protein
MVALTHPQSGQKARRGDDRTSVAEGEASASVSVSFVFCAFAITLFRSLPPPGDRERLATALSWRRR